MPLIAARAMCSASRGSDLGTAWAAISDAASSFAAAVVCNTSIHARCGRLEDHRREPIPQGKDPKEFGEPKVEHHEGRGIRSCPIFPELRSILDEAFEIFGDKSEN